MDILFTQKQIAAQVTRLAAQIKADMGDDFTCVALMDGAFMFAADLMRALHVIGVNPHFESLSLSSYGDERQSSGHVTIKSLSRASLSGKSVLIVDDVLETGGTLKVAREAALARGASKVKICVFARKPNAQSAKKGEQIKADYIGWDAPDRFLVGYGLDDKGRYRGQPFISAV